MGNTPRSIDKPATAKRGSLLAISEGCYSDYRINGFFVVLQEFTPAAIKDEMLAAAGDEWADKYRLHDAYIAELVRRGLLLEIGYAELHVGDYSGFDAFNFGGGDE